MDLADELIELKIDNLLAQLTFKEKVVILKKLLGPLTDIDILSHREASFFFCNTARSASYATIGREFGVSPQRVHEVLVNTERKIVVAKKGPTH